MLVQAHTGMAYAELYNLCPDWIYKGVDGGLWVEFFRQKTKKRKGHKVRMPLDDTVLGIIERYKDHPKCRASGRCLPVRSNNEYNRHLKSIAALFGLPEGLSTHHLRKTAGMILLNNDVPIESVAKILGSTEAVVKVHYARILEEKLSRDLSAYRQRMKNKNQ
jgi:integrase